MRQRGPPLLRCPRWGQPAITAGAGGAGTAFWTTAVVGSVSMVSAVTVCSAYSPSDSAKPAAIRNHFTVRLSRCLNTSLRIMVASTAASIVIVGPPDALTYWTRQVWK